jgi:hypothetical protein
MYALLLITSQAIVLYVLHRLVKAFGSYTETFLAAHKSSLLMYQSNERRVERLLKIETLLQSSPEYAAAYAAQFVADDTQKESA